MTAKNACSCTRKAIVEAAVLLAAAGAASSRAIFMIAGAVGCLYDQGRRVLRLFLLTGEVTTIVQSSLKSGFSSHPAGSGSVSGGNFSSPASASRRAMSSASVGSGARTPGGGMNAGLAKIGWDSVGGDLNAGLASVDDDPGIDFVTNAGVTFFVTNDGVGFVNKAGEASAAVMGWSSMPSSAKSALRCALSFDKSASMAAARCRHPAAWRVWRLTHNTLCTVNEEVISPRRHLGTTLRCMGLEPFRRTGRWRGFGTSACTSPSRPWP